MNENQPKFGHLNALKEALTKTLEQLSNRKSVSSQAKIISSWNEEYDYGGINLFEISFVDALVSNLAAVEGIGSIGWEVNYPWNQNGNIWYRKKLDVAIGHIIVESKRKDREPQALFEMPIEVKKLPVTPLSKNGDFSVESEMYIWQDIFKLYGYKLTDDFRCQQLNGQVGKEKIVLCFSEVATGAIGDFKKNIEKRFVHNMRLKEKETFKGGWLSKKDFEKIELENSEREFDLDYLLEKFLYWFNPNDRQFLIKDCGLSLMDTGIVKSCDFLTYELLNSKTTLVVSILYLN